MFWFFLAACFSPDLVISRGLKACDIASTTGDPELRRPCEALNHLAQAHKAFLVSRALHYTQAPRVYAGIYGKNRIP